MTHVKTKQEIKNGEISKGMKATLTNYTQSPRKVRLVTDLVKGKSVPEALTLLQFEMRRAANPIAKLVFSAASNAENKGEDPKDLIVKNITVDKGIVLKRFMPRAFGRASTIRRRRSHVTVTLAKRDENGVVNKKKKKEAHSSSPKTKN